MSTKHIFDSSDGLVLKALKGAVALNPDLRLHAPTKSVYAKTRNNARVALISGGGAGHEPAHAGYTGRGMLAASVSGDIFASPSASQILSCIQLALAAQETNQVLLVVNNYTGDRLNFGLAAERALGLSLPSKEGNESGIGKVEVETVVVADDVSLLDRPSLVGPRGLAGNILVCKILGAAAETGLTFSGVKKLGDAVVANLASIGVGLAHCHVPGRSISSDEGMVEDGMCELGLGLHNEPGACKLQIGSSENLVRAMLEQILSSTERRAKARGEPEGEKNFMQSDDEVVLYVNNLGGMSILEMSAVVDEAISQLESKNIHPTRILLSSYMTSLNAPGFSLSLLNLSAICRVTQSRSDDVLVVSDSSSDSDLSEAITLTKLLSFIDYPTEATAWAGIRTHWPAPGIRRDRVSEEEEAFRLLSTFTNSSVQRPRGTAGSEQATSSSSWAPLGIDHERIKSCIRSACKSVVRVENELTRFDTVVGDGDCGATFSSGARAVLSALDEEEIRMESLTPAELMRTLSELLLDSMGGTSGALFGLYFTALSNALPSTSTKLETSQSKSNTRDLETAPLAALRALSSHTPARPGDRTIVDALHPFSTSLAAGEGLEVAVKKARDGAESTRGMRAKLGRATYVGTATGGGSPSPGTDENGAKDSDLPPDPGAWGVAALLEGLVQGSRA